MFGSTMRPEEPCATQRATVCFERPCGASAPFGMCLAASAEQFSEGVTRAWHDAMNRLSWLVCSRSTRPALSWMCSGGSDPAEPGGPIRSWALGPRPAPHAARAQDRVLTLPRSRMALAERLADEFQEKHFVICGRQRLATFGNPS